MQFVPQCSENIEPQPGRGGRKKERGKRREEERKREEARGEADRQIELKN